MRRRGRPTNTRRPAPCGPAFAKILRPAISRGSLHLTSDNEEPSMTALKSRPSSPYLSACSRSADLPTRIAPESAGISPARFGKGNRGSETPGLPGKKQDDPNPNKTTAGNYFISNYPPFSCWTPGEIPELTRVICRPPNATPLSLYV